jgi:hypothetical protein
MGGAAPRFCVHPSQEPFGGGLLTRCDEMTVVEDGREHHKHWFQLLRHPDAQLIEAAPDLLAACQLVLASLDGEDACDARTVLSEAIAKATMSECAVEKGGH